MNGPLDTNDYLWKAIAAHNAAMEKECLQWTCRERDDGERCPNCPMDHMILLCQDGQPCKGASECQARGKCRVFKGTPMEAPPWIAIP